MLKKLVVFAAVIISGSAHAQDYVVNLQGDTVRGKVSILGYDIIDRINLKVDKKKIDYTAVHVRSVMMDNNTYTPVKTDKGYRMMKLVSKGFVSKYLARGATNTYDIDYLVLRDGRATDIPNISFKRTIADFLKDCTSIEKIIEDNGYNKKKLDELIAAYNQCIEDQTRTATTTTPALSSNDPLMVALTNLQTKIDKDTSIASRKDALDVLNDITSKVKNKQKVPNYLTEGLKDFLKDAPAYQTELDNITALLKSN